MKNYTTELNKRIMMKNLPTSNFKENKFETVKTNTHFHVSLIWESLANLKYPTFALIALLSMIGGVWGQTAKATWALTADASVSTTGNITATSMTLGAGVNAPSYTTNGVVITGFNGATCTPNNNDYFEYTVSSNCGNDLTVTSITFTANVSAGTRCLQLFQSVDGATETQVSCNTTSCSGSNFSTTTTAQNFTTGTISISVSQGKTIRLRLYGSVDNGTRSITLKNFVVNGTTSSVSQLTPSVSLSSNDADNTFCSGTNVTFTATASNTGGGAVTYTFKKNGSNVQSGSSTTYSASDLANNNQISVDISISGGTCLASTTAISSTITNTVNTIPAISGTTPNSRCGTGTVVLGATASTGTINWYAAASGGSSLGTGTSYTTPSISSTTSYYVDATSNSCTTASRTAVTATVNSVPAAATLSAPANAASGQSTTPTLSWNAVSGATSYDVYLGTSSPGTFVGNVSTNSYTPSSALNGSTVYYWNIVAKNACGNAVASSIRSFTTTCSNACNSVCPNVIASLPVSNQSLTCTSTAVPGNFSSSNVTVCGGATSSYLGGQEAVYIFTPSGTGEITISYSGQTWSAIWLFAGCPTSGGTCVGSVGSSASSQSLTVNVTSGVTYYLLFDTYPSPNSPCAGTFSITAVVTCVPPSSLTASNLTTTTANLSWNAASPAPASGYDIYYSTSSTAPTSGTAAMTTTSAGVTTKNITGLTAATTYYFWVRSNCGGGDKSTWSSSGTFSTACNPISSFPWTENFNSVTTPNLPSCWSVNNANSDADSWIAYTTYGVSSTNCVGLYTDGNGGSNNDYLILPYFQLNGSQQLKFSVRAYSSGEPNDYKVMLSTTGSSPANFTTELLPLTTVSSTTMTQITPINLSAYSGNVYIAIYVPSGGLDGWYIYFDDFTIENIPAATISSFSPSSSCVGSTVTINGANFTSATSVKFNGVEATSFNIVNSTQITAVVPAATNGTISVTNPGGTALSASSFTVSSTPPTPTVSVTGSSTINVGGTASLSATTSGGNLNWYTIIGGSIINTGSSYNLPVQCSSGSTTYYVQEVGSGSCNSPLGSTTITVRPVIAANPANAIICTSGGSVALSAQLTNASGITWSGSNLSTTSGASTVASPTSTATYTLSATVTGCSTINSTQNVGVIEGVSFTPSATPSSVCEGATSILSSNLSSSGFTSSSVTFAPSTAPASPTVVCNACGTDDGSWNNISIPFNYNFFGNTYNSVNIGSNGILMFGSTTGISQYTFDSGNMPNSAYPANIIAAAAVDLRVTSGQVRYWSEGTSPTRTFVVEYLNVAGYSGGSNTAQIKLFETTGNVEIHVTNASAYGTASNKVVGLQDLNKTVGATAYSNTATITNQAWKFVPGANYSFQWSTAGSNISNATSTSYTTPTLSTPGTVTYTVAATNPNTSCASTANVSVTVNARPAAPVSSGDVTACGNAGAQNLVVTTYSGVTADWYAGASLGSVLTSPSSGTGTLSYSIPSPSSTVTYYAEARNSTTGCTSTSRTGVTLNVNASPSAPTVSTPVTYCQGATASALTATAGVGNTLKWYTAAPNFPSVTGATLTGSAPTPSTSSAGSTEYFVSQTSGGCESILAKIVVTINATPATPTASDPSAYCQNASASQLTATAASGCTLYWYNDPTTSAGQTTTAPTPSTTNSGTVSYYVANRSNTTSCEGSRKTITVTVNPSITASVSNSASSTSACGGGSITFTATPTNGGASPTYQWKLNGNNVGSNLTTYTLSSPNSGDYVSVSMTPSAQTCLTSGAATNSNTITLTSTASTPTVSIQSTASSAICPGTSVTFSVNSSTNMGASPTYIWKKGGVAISGATNSTYTTTGLVNGDQITLEMTSSLSAGCLNNTSATSSAITTTVNAATAISSQPVATSACLGSNATFSVSASGQGTLTYQWKKAGTNITGNATANTSSLTLSGIVSGDAANYSVDVTGSCGTVSSSSVALSINTATSISGQPSAVTQCANTTANFSVTAAGQGTLSYQWKKDGASIGGATNSTLSVSNISSANAGQYTVDVTGGCGTLTSSQALLSVNAASAISAQPSAATICAGNTANFSVTATGTGTLTYQWKRDGTNVGTNSSSLAVSNAQAANAGNYTVEVSGTCGTATSNNALLTVNPITSITTQPTASAGCEGQNTTFTVVAAGTAPLSYQWKFGGTNINGATSSTYNIPSTTNANDGSYFVTVTGGCGTVNSSAVNLTVYPTPIANAGADQTVCPGESITLTGSGVTGGTYTWNNSVQNGVQFNAPSTTTTYTVTGTSANGCPDTDEVLVTIKDKPTVSIGGTTTICIATSTNLTASGTVGNTYAWSNGGNTAGITVTPASTTSYTVTATGTNGCTNTATQSVTVNTPTIPYSISGKEYYIWRGASSTVYETANNWYYKGTNDVWSIATQAPQASNSVLIPSGTCVTQAPVMSANSSTSDSLIVLTGATLSFTGNPNIQVNNDVVVRNGGTLSLGNGGAVLEIVDGSLKLLGNSTFTPGNGTVKFHNTATHPESHTLVCESANNNTFYKIDFHGDNGTEAYDFNLGSNINVTSELKVSTTNFKLNGYYVDLGSTGVITEGTNGKKVYDIGNGYVTAQKNILADGTTYNPGNLGFSILAASGKPLGNTTVKRYHTQVTDNLSAMGPAISRYYSITPQFNGGSGNTYTDGLNATVTFNYTNVNLTSTGHSESALSLYRKGSGDTQWEQLNGTLSTNNKTLTVPNFPRFSDVTLGGGGQPLPVELVSFSGACEDGIINLTWQTASEFNSSHFDVEKSRDGENWQLLSTIPSAGTSNELITYQTADENATDGNNYFRLRQLDIDGAEKLYNPINVSCSEVSTGYFSSFPNPSGSNFQVILNNKELSGACELNIVDASGKLIEQRHVEVKDGINMFVINQELNPGIYFLNITNGLKSTPVLRHAIK